MKYPKLILLYGRFQKETNKKQTLMINGDCTCGYRPYAKKFGEIIYLAPQETKETWDCSISDPDALLEYLSLYPEAIVWSIKHCPEKDKVLKSIDNKKVYYSCCSINMYNRYCDISLVDLPERVKSNGHLWVKGKDPDYWLPSKYKVIDFLIMGRRGDKNELFFLTAMEKAKNDYTIQWIGGKAFKDRANSHKHHFMYTKFHSMDNVRKLIPCSKVGVILSEHPAEGFPQTFLEMTMCGLPVIYLSQGTCSRTYMNNAIMVADKNNIVVVAERVLENWSVEQSRKVRQCAIDNYSLEKSYESILKGLGLCTN